MDEVIRIENLNVSYGANMVLQDISTDFKRNKITAIIGHSGSGKSTLLAAINKLIDLEENAKATGKIYFNETDTNLIKEEDLRSRIGTVFQSPVPFPISIRKNMEFAPVFNGIKDKQLLNELIVEKLKIVGLYDEVKGDLEKSAAKLSGGQQQRLCIARALTANPEVLLLDEPCSALDFQNTRLIEDLLVTLKEKYTIIIVTHDLHEAKRIADDCIFLSDGKIVESGDFKEMIHNPKSLETAAYLENLKD